MLSRNSNNFYYYIFIVLFVACTNSNDNQNKAVFVNCDFCVRESQIDYIERYKVLQASYEDLSKADNQIKFYCCFPKNFNEFELLFGYVDISQNNYDTLIMKGNEYIITDKEAPLYDYANEYIDTFFDRLESVSKNIKIKNVIEIAFAGVWDSDGVNIFQLYLQGDMIEYFKNYLILLDKYTDKEILSFWHFYFDGPHPKNYQKDFDELYKRYSEQNMRIASLMKEAYLELLTEKKH